MPDPVEAIVAEADRDKTKLERPGLAVNELFGVENVLYAEYELSVVLKRIDDVLEWFCVLSVDVTWAKNDPDIV